MTRGYRIGWPEEMVAWKVLDFEYTELGNEQTLEDLAHFLGMVKVTPFGEEPTADWQTILAEFRRRHGEAEGVWICPTLRDALTYYGQWYGEGAVIYQVGYDPGNVVIDLGPDGIFVLKPEYLQEVGVDLLAPLKGLMARVYESHRAKYGNLEPKTKYVPLEEKYRLVKRTKRGSLVVIQREGNKAILEIPNHEDMMDISNLLNASGIKWEMRSGISKPAWEGTPAHLRRPRGIGKDYPGHTIMFDFSDLEKVMEGRLLQPLMLED